MDNLEDLYIDPNTTPMPQWSEAKKREMTERLKACIPQWSEAKKREMAERLKAIKLNLASLKKRAEKAFAMGRRDLLRRCMVDSEKLVADLRKLEADFK